MLDQTLTVRVHDCIASGEFLPRGHACACRERVSQADAARMVADGAAIWYEPRPGGAVFRSIVLCRNGRTPTEKSSSHRCKETLTAGVGPSQMETKVAPLPLRVTKAQMRKKGSCGFDERKLTGSKISDSFAYVRGEQ